MTDPKFLGIGALASLKADTLYRAWGLLVLAGLGIGGIVVPASIITTIICPDVRPSSPTPSPILHPTDISSGPYRDRRSPHPRHPRHRWLHWLHNLLQRLRLQIRPQRYLLHRRRHGTRTRHHQSQSH